MSAVEDLPWRTSTRSSNGEKCVQVAPTHDDVMIRHSKRPQDGAISFSPPAWARFVFEALNEHGPANGVATISRVGPDTLVRSVHDDVTLLFDHEEWTAFLQGATHGEFDFGPALSQ